MNFINQINGFIAKSLGFLNAVLAILLVLFATAISIGWVGGFSRTRPLGWGGNGRGGFAVCSPWLINIRDLLAESLAQRRTLDDQRDKSEDSRTGVLA